MSHVTSEPIIGTNGDDRLLGDSGENRLIGRGGNDVLIGGNGADELSGNDGDDVLNGGAGNDELYGGLNDDRLFGANGDDVMFGNAGDDLLSGGPGDDYLNGAAGDDALKGGGGNDYLVGHNGLDSLFGGAGADSLKGGSGGDLMDGGVGDDRLSGEAGNDILTGGGGNDRLLGGDGDDLAVFSHSTDDFLISDGPKTGSFVVINTGDGLEGRDVLFSVETAQFENGIFNIADLADGSAVIARDLVVGAPDILIGSFNGPTTFLLGDGAGGFMAASGSGLPNGAETISVFDYDGDGDLDFYGSGGPGGVSSDNPLWENQGGGVFTNVNAPFGGPNGETASAGDFNGDGVTDIFTGGPDGNQVFFGQGEGLFGGAVSISGPGSPTASTIADFNGDGLDDLMVGAQGANEVFLYGGSDFSAGSTLPGGARNTEQIIAMDLTGDGAPDAVIINSDGNSVVLHNIGSGEFQASNLPGSSNSWGGDVGDIDGDGDLDIILARHVDGSTGAANQLWINQGDGTYALDQTFNGGDGVTTGIRLSDMDGDGDLDIIGNDYNSRAFTQFNDGAGNFDSPVFAPDTPTGGWNIDAAPIYSTPVNSDPYDDLIDFTFYFLIGAERSQPAPGAQVNANLETFSFIAINGQSLADGAVVTTEDGLRISDAGNGALNIDSTGFDSSGAPVASGYYVAGTASFEYTIEDENGNISSANIDLTIWGEQGGESDSDAVRAAADFTLLESPGEGGSETLNAPMGPPAGADGLLFHADIWIKPGTAETPAEIYSEAFAPIDAL